MSKLAAVISIVLIVLEIAVFIWRARDFSLQTLAFYTVISNLVTLLSCAMLLFSGDGAFTALVRYLATCMMTMTFLVVVFVLIPMGKTAKELLFSGSGLFHHLICPVLCFVSYVFLEPHSRLWPVPVLVTFAYGMLMLWLNHKGKVDGPYPFFRVHRQKTSATVLWMAVLTCLIAVISIAISLIAR